MTLIDKRNLDLIYTEEYSLHDSIVSSLNFNPELKSFVMVTQSYEGKRVELCFKNVHSFEYFYDRFGDINENRLYGWEVIPNEINKDNYINNVKDEYLKNDVMWNDELFATSFLFINSSDFKIVCERITFDLAE
jgi:hypothetical protein